MQAFVSQVRKDGKYPVTYAFDNGRRIKKIVDKETMLKALEDSTPIEPKTPHFTSQSLCDTIYRER